MADQKRVGARERDGLVQMAGKALVGKCGIQLDAGHFIRGIQVNGVGRIDIGGRCEIKGGA